MRNKKIVTCFIIINIIIIVIIYALINKKVNITKENKIIKEMNTSEYDSQITELNKSHEDYAMQAQANKKKLAQAISNEKVATSENATIDEMVTNIGKILQARTSDATATEDNITEGKTAYVNGKLIIGNGKDNNEYYNKGKDLYANEWSKIENVTIKTSYHYSEPKFMNYGKLYKYSFQLEGIPINTPIKVISDSKYFPKEDIFGNGVGAGYGYMEFKFDTKGYLTIIRQSIQNAGWASGTVYYFID